MWECSGNQIDSKPSASAVVANSTGFIVSAVGKMAAAILIAQPIHALTAARSSSGFVPVGLTSRWVTPTPA